MKRTIKKGLTLIAAAVLLPVLTTPAHAAKIWDAGEAIKFTVAGDDDMMFPSFEGDEDDNNGVQKAEFTASEYSDSDHWIDPAESLPYSDGSKVESLPLNDMTVLAVAGEVNGFNSNTPVMKDGLPTWTFFAPHADGIFKFWFYGDDSSQTLGAGETGSRNDVMNCENTWDLDPETEDDSESGAPQNLVARISPTPTPKQHKAIPVVGVAQFTFLQTSNDSLFSTQSRAVNKFSSDSLGPVHAPTQNRTEDPAKFGFHKRVELRVKLKSFKSGATFEILQGTSREWIMMGKHTADDKGGYIQDNTITATFLSGPNHFGWQAKDTIYLWDSPGQDTDSQGRYPTYTTFSGSIGLEIHDKFKDVVVGTYKGKRALPNNATHHWHRNLEMVANPYNTPFRVINNVDN